MKITPAIKMLFVLAIALLSIIQIIDYLNFGVDDVFISMRVAENVANGNGAVFNAGKNVEGYSNPLWVGLLAAGAKLGFNSAHSETALLWFAKALSFLFGIGTCILLFFIAKNFGAGKDFPVPIGIISLLTAISCGPFILWSLGGMETTLTAFLFTLSIFLFQRITAASKTSEKIPRLISIFFSISLALVALTRPEPVLHAIAAIIFFIIVFKNQLRLKDILAVVLPFVIIFSIFLAWRYATFGELVPNTFYAKTGGGLKSYGLSIKYLFGGIFFIGGPFFLSLLFITETRHSPVFKYCLLMISVSVIFILYSGGDWMAGYRFFIPVAPAFFLLSAIGISELAAKLPASVKEKKQTWQFSGFIIFLGICSAFAGRILIRGQIPIEPAWSQRTGHSTPWDYVVGAWLRDHAPKTSVVATNEDGLIGYMNPLMRIIDLGGLSDKHIAQHFKHGEPADADYVLNQNPDYITLPSTAENALAMNGMANILARAKPDPLPTLDFCTAIASSEKFTSNYHIEQKFPSLDLYARNK